MAGELLLVAGCCSAVLRARGLHALPVVPLSLSCCCCCCAAIAPKPEPAASPAWSRRQSMRSSRDQWPPCRDPRKQRATLFLACQILTCLAECVQQPSSHGAVRQASEDWDDPVAASLGRQHTLDPESRVGAGVERVRLVRSAASRCWPVVAGNAVEIRVEVVPQLGGASTRSLAVVGRQVPSTGWRSVGSLRWCRENGEGEGC